MPKETAFNDKTMPMTQAQMDRFKMPTINSQLPLIYANGHVLKHFQGSCSVCHTRIKSANLHGEILQPFASIAIIEAVGLCHCCKIAVPFYMRLRNDGSMDSLDSKGTWIPSAAEEAKFPLEKLLALTLAVIVVVTCASWTFR
jgi:hypothetical protein